MLNKVFEPFNKERQRRFERNRDINFPIKMKNFFELKNENLKVFNKLLPHQEYTINHN